MTNDHVSDFAASLVEMAQSHKKVPTLEAHVAQLEAALNERAAQVQKLELRIIDLKNDQDSLYSKLRSVEAERDEVSFRLLEEEDKVTVVRHLLGSAQAAVGDAVRMVEPKPLPVETGLAEPQSTGQENQQPAEAKPELVVEAKPTEGGELQQNPIGQAATIATEPVSDTAKWESGPTLGQSVPDPTSAERSYTNTQMEQSSMSSVSPLQGQSEALPTAQFGIAESTAMIPSASGSIYADSQPRPGSSATIGDDEPIDWPTQFNRQYS